MDVAKLATTVISQAAGKALAAQGIPGGEAIIEAVLGEFLELQDAQWETLSRIDNRLAQMMEGPWRTARLYVEEASLPGRSPGARAASLSEAAKRLRDAIPLQPEGSVQRACACIDLAMTLKLLSEDAGCRMYARQALVNLEGAVRDYKKQVRSTAWGTTYDIGARGPLPPTKSAADLAAAIIEARDLIGSKPRRKRDPRGYDGQRRSRAYWQLKAAFMDGISSEVSRICVLAEVLCGHGDATTSHYVQSIGDISRFLLRGMELNPFPPKGSHLTAGR